MTAMARDAVAVLDAAGVASRCGVRRIDGRTGRAAPGRRSSATCCATSCWRRRRPAATHGVDRGPADQAALLGKGARTPEDAYRLACTVLYSPQFQRTHPDFIEAQIRERARHPVRPRVFSAQFLAMCATGQLVRASGRGVACRHSSCTAPTMSSPVRERAHPRAADSRRARCVRSTAAGTSSSTSVPAETARVVDEHLRRSP